MTITINDELALSNDAPLDYIRVHDFLKNYSPEVAQGYLLALKDVFGEVNLIMNINAGKSDSLFLKHADARIRNNMIDFYNEKRGLLHCFIKEKVQLPSPAMKQS